MIDLDSPPTGYTYDPELAQLHRRALQLMSRNTGLDYLEAVHLARGGDPPPLADTTGAQFDPSRLALHRRAIQFRAETGAGYIAAVQAVERDVMMLSLRAEPDGRATMRLRATAVMESQSAFSGLAYSGGPVDAYDNTYAIDLEQLKIPSTGEVSLLRNHDPNQVAGRCQVTNNGKTLRIERGTFTQVTAAGREASGLYAEGHPLSLSVGVSGRMEQLGGRKSKAVINGRQQQLSAVIRNARLLEVSLVHAGADPEASID